MFHCRQTCRPPLLHSCPALPEHRPAGQCQLACPRLQRCDNSRCEQLVAALPAQLDAQGWGMQQAGLGEGVAGQGQLAPGP
ncbi:hypothetical protein HaLaN_04707 [Haematococcus lacustris]|uniref:Uncharacterized protein n=1 Tax=Haematococcus lacustris TaxID=44745 RepID=A0A699YH71_HAELA|nr:hypothetical protein HaLaN_04707 [Haematococcus lacustris]